MTWTPVRKATEDDYDVLRARAQRFIERHADEVQTILGFVPEPNEFDPIDSLTAIRDYDGSAHVASCHATRLRPLIKALFLRAIGDEGIAYGYVGHQAD